jgi:PadR family transcriptional regulator, regulatory protein PadR
MGSRRDFSPQTASVLAALFSQPTAWQHGYALARETGLKSGTLYPILIRLAERGLVEACWQEEPTPGRPRRHLYRLTPDGLASATAEVVRAEPAGAALAGAKPAGTERRLGARPRRGHGVAAPAAP